MLVQVESSSDLAVVGQSFGPAFPASWSVSGNTGTLTISAATHEQMRAEAADSLPVPGTFTPIVIQIDLTSLEATSQVASGQLVSGPSRARLHAAGARHHGDGRVRGTERAAALLHLAAADRPALPVHSGFCGQTCTLVPGSAYDPASGEINLVGRETQSGCDGTVCQGPFDFFTPRGDLRLTEAAEVPALPGLAVSRCRALAASGRVLRAR